MVVELGFQYENESLEAQQTWEFALSHATTTK